MSEETIPQMRERIEALEKQTKEATQAREAAEARARLFEARDAFREKGLNPKHADLFVSNHTGDITADAVGAFATEYGLAPVTQPTTETATGEGQDPSSDAALAALSRAGSGAGEGGAAAAGDGPMPREEWEALNARDPNAARALLRQGKVQIRGDNPWRTR